jgi:tRNA(fMet)-specific endonuclease VapC
MKGLYDLNDKFRKVKPENCLISEITLAELKFGVENSQNKERNQKALDNFLSGIVIIAIFQAIDNYAQEKARLRRS